MKNSPMRVMLITMLVTTIICLVVGHFVLESYKPHSIGDIVTETVEVGSEIGEVSNGSTGTRTATFVYLGACSKLYKSEDATESCGIFLDMFDHVELAELIDSTGFPYRQEYVAATSSANPVRYMIKTVSGETFWVEP